jgi:uncharacterized membrane protein YbhN (UPF0104 family)
MPHEARGSSGPDPAADVNAPAAPERRALAPAGRVLRWILAAVLLLLIVRLVVRDPAPLLMLGDVDAVVLGVMAALIVLNQWLMSWRLKLVMHIVGARLTHWQWFRLTSLGQFLNLFVPQLGHLHRGLVLKRDFGISYPRYASGLLLFFWIELLTSVLLAVGVVAAVDPGYRVGPVGVLLPLLGGLVALTLGPVVLVLQVLGRRIVSTRVQTIIGRLRPLCDDLRKAAWQPRFLISFFALNAVVASGHVAMLSLAFDAVGGRLGVSQLGLFQVLLKLTNQVAITPGNVGLTELCYGALAQASDGSMQRGIAAAVLLRTLGTLMTIAIGCVVGGLPLLFGGRPGPGAWPQSKGTSN